MEKSNTYVSPKEGSKVHKAKYHDYLKKIAYLLL